MLVFKCFMNVCHAKSQNTRGQSSYLVNDDVPPPLAGGPQHLLEAPGGLLDHLLPLALVVLLAGLTVHLENREN